MPRRAPTPAIIPHDAADRWLRITEVVGLTGKSDSSIYLAMSQGRFPQAIKLGTRCTRWSLREVEAWMAEQMNVARQPRRAPDAAHASAQ
jgi:prophage regulatory protein